MSRRRGALVEMWAAFIGLAIVGGVTSPALGQETRSVAAIDNAFRPMEIAVPVGTTLVWTNAGHNPHTVTADDRAFDSGTLESGDTFSVTFDREGRVPYYCQIHGAPGSGMFGIVLVQASGGEQDEVPPAAGEGLARTGLDPVPLGLTAVGLGVVGLLALGVARKRRRGEVMGWTGPGDAIIETRRKG